MTFQDWQKLTHNYQRSTCDMFLQGVFAEIRVVDYVATDSVWMVRGITKFNNSHPISRHVEREVAELLATKLRLLQP